MGANITVTTITRSEKNLINLSKEVSAPKGYYDKIIMSKVL